MKRKRHTPEQIIAKLRDAAGILVLPASDPSYTRIEGNTADGNDIGIQVASAGNIIIRNSASGNTTNYNIFAGNKVGPVISVPDSMMIHGSTGGTGVGTTDPWANFSY